MNFEKWLEDYAPTAPETLDECVKDAWLAGQKAERAACEAVARGFAVQGLRTVVDSIADAIAVRSKRSN